MAAYRDRVSGARVIVTSLYGSLQAHSLCCKENCNNYVRQFTGSVYGSGVIGTKFYGSFQGQILLWKGNCNESVWQLTGTGFMVQA